MKGTRRMKNLAQAAMLAVGASLAASPLGVSAASAATTTPIQHLVIVFQENVSFDHYFATYPIAKNPGTEPVFTAIAGTPNVNGLTSSLLGHNPNALNPANAGLPKGAAPFRLDRNQAVTCDQDHDYTPEQTSFDFGLMDGFPASVGSTGCSTTTDFSYGHATGLVMGYFDGNTVTAMWNYAQNFAMSDNSFDTTFGPSVPGMINLISGQTGGVTVDNNPSGNVVDGSVIGDPDPIGDTCSSATAEQVTLGGKNIGDLLNTAGLTWGWFEGGFNLSIINSDGTTGCLRDHPAATGGVKKDYIPHHEPFQYYTSTANPTHARPTSTAMIGQTDAANHQYDSADFFAALAAGNLPAVSFVKAPAFQDGHAGYSSPLSEQSWVVNTLNTIQKSALWSSTAVVIAWDDSDGWYDHQMPPIVNPSATSSDTLSGSGKCGNGTPAAGIQARCGYGPRLPLLVVSPFAKANFVDGTLTDLSSILKFIETNWSTGAIGGGSFDSLAGTLNNMFDFTLTTNRTLILSPTTGEPM